jgi:hypothetical protein
MHFDKGSLIVFNIHAYLCCFGVNGLSLSKRRKMLLGNFICWLAVLNRLTIEVRQVHLGRSLDPTCMFCNAHPKDVGHILFTCQFTKYIWNAFSRNEAFTDRLVIGCASSNGKRRNLKKRCFLSVELLRISSFAYV